MTLMSSLNPRSAVSPFAIGDPGRAASELPAGPPGMPIGQADAELSAAALPGMIIRAASVRGLLHRFNGTPGQDAFAIAQHQHEELDAPRAIAVVCDGVGALGRSHEAARLVSRLLAGAGMKVPWPDAFVQANEELHALAAQASSCGSDDADLRGMATTAVAAVVHRVADTWMLSGAWVGDSSLWHLGGEGRWSLLAGAAQEDSEEAFHSSGVRPLPSIDGACVADEFSVRGGAIFLMSERCRQSTAMERRSAGDPRQVVGPTARSLHLRGPSRLRPQVTHGRPDRRRNMGRFRRRCPGQRSGVSQPPGVR